jgi:asparagine synthetase B (glutamine-hydrolysing)
MCGIVVSTKPINESTLNLLKLRGPDNTSILDVNGITFIHTLLSLTGSLTTQPIVDGDIVCLFNGEIYNYNKKYESDVYHIINDYKEFGDNFVKKLDGEFAITLIDFKKNVIYISSDVFSTKPIYYDISVSGVGVSTYESILRNNGFNNITKLPPNTTLKFDLTTKEIIKKESVYVFDLTQNIDSFSEWEDNFIKSLKKRFTNIQHDIILPLSSGHDSGAIACGLDILKIPYTTFSFQGKENLDIIKKRVKSENIIKSYIQDNSINKIKLKEGLSNNCEPFFYGSSYNKKSIDGFNDPGALGLYHLLKTVKNENPNIRIMASGQGSDEIMSNIQAYTFGKSNPIKHDENISTYFPWENFYHGSQFSYLQKEEFVTGSFGVESRYPFLDKDVVQSFLNLSVKLKNDSFKSPLTFFLEKNNYTTNNKKLGFNPF